MLTIYHNPRCAKSRQGVAYLEAQKQDFETVLYLKDKINASELTALIGQLGIPPMDLVRKTEKIWKETFKGIDLSDQEIIDAMVANPKLIERPIVSNGTKAVIGRPTESIQTIL